MTISDWNTFYRSISIGASSGIAVDKPTVSQLDSFEVKTGLLLPKSYREYIIAFGPGDFAGNMRIAAPGYSNLSCPTCDLIAADEAFGYRGADTRYFKPEEQKRLGRLFYFGLESEREWLGWDPHDIRDPLLHEYGIYRVGLSTIRFAASSFHELIETICGRLFEPDPEWDEEELGPQRVFHPATYDLQS